MKEFFVWQNQHNGVEIVEGEQDHRFGFFSTKLAGPFASWEEADKWAADNLPDD